MTDDHIPPPAPDAPPAPVEENEVLRATRERQQQKEAAEATEAADKAAADKAAADGDGKRIGWKTAAAAGIGIGSAAVLAALLYASRDRK